MGNVIGITSSQNMKDNQFTLTRMYVRAIEAAGGLPFILPVTENKKLIGEMLDQIDGLLLSGGVDVDPLLFGEEPIPGMGRIDPERDQFEWEITRLALEREIPILAICRGCQMLNVVAGGSVVQDIQSALGQEKMIKHDQAAPRWYLTHTIDILQDTRMERIFQKKELKVNSFHHQSVKAVAPGFIASARARDGIIEAIESKEHPYALGIQCHPELLWERYDEYLDLFKDFVDAARR